MIFQVALDDIQSCDNANDRYSIPARPVDRIIIDAVEYEILSLLSYFNVQPGHWKGLTTALMLAVSSGTGMRKAKKS
jgi:hypothetical protein